jgi:hypothetical protein
MDSVDHVRSMGSDDGLFCWPVSEVYLFYLLDGKMLLIENLAKGFRERGVKSFKKLIVCGLLAVILEFDYKSILLF